MSPGDRNASSRQDLGELAQPLGGRDRRSRFGRSDKRRGGDRFGQFAERFARFMGTAAFLAYMTVFVVVWIAWNVLAPDRLRFDPYAFIFLTLMLSLQASYAAPLILLAQNRQTDRDRVSIEQDRSRDERNLAETEYLTREVAALRIAMRDTATRDFVRSELRSLLDELDDRDRLRRDTAAPTDLAAADPAPAGAASAGSGAVSARSTDVTDRQHDGPDEQPDRSLHEPGGAAPDMRGPGA